MPIVYPIIVGATQGHTAAPVYDFSLEFVQYKQIDYKKGKNKLALKNWKNLFGEQREDSFTSLEV